MRSLISAICIVMVFQQVSCLNQPAETAIWQSLPPIPDKIGFAGSFAGVSHGALIVAGGANFPDGGAPWSGSVKKWANKVFVLENPGGSWNVSDSLPASLGYGGSISYNNQLMMIGGSNVDGHTKNVISVEWINDSLVYQNWPDLPTTIANMSAVLLDQYVYVAGGITTPDAKQASDNFWRLNLQQPGSGWEVLPTWPGAPRMLAVTGTMGGKVYVASGVELIDGQRNYLKDAYCFDPSVGWKKIADLPASVAAAPSPALAFEDGLMIMGGDDGTLAEHASVLKNKHPGFSNHMLAYYPAMNGWKEISTLDTSASPRLFSPVTTTAVVWKDLYVLPGGEVRPAVRTNGVIALDIRNERLKKQ